MKKRSIKYFSGFTLIELLVVVLIIGILAAVAVPQYQVAVRKAKMMSMMPVIKAIDTAQQVYRLANGTYSGSFEELDVQLPAGGTVVPANNESDTPTISYPGFGCYMWRADQMHGTSAYCLLTQQDEILMRLEKRFREPYYICWAHPDNSISTKVCKSVADNYENNGNMNNGAQEKGWHINF